MPEVHVEELHRLPVQEQRVELVERKGLGHPDSICDAIAEAVSQALCREYLARVGRILHHNVDKALLVAGRTEPRPGGGKVLEPMRLVLGDRAAASCGAERFAVADIAEASARQWVSEHLPHVDPARHFVFQNELKEGSPELTDIFERAVMSANDTSAAVGYAPLSETERLVLEAERQINSAGFKSRYPEAGEDVKVMGLRIGRELRLTVALAFVDRFVAGPQHYFRRKEEMRHDLEASLARQLDSLQSVSVALNTLDDPRRGAGGMYLTVLGTSAEGGDCGQVGRGNRVNGIIAVSRPMSAEAAPGKNPVSHVGKIYSVLSHELARRIHAEVPGLSEVYVLLCSEIGRPLDEPILAAVQIIPAPGCVLADVRERLQAMVRAGLAGIPALGRELARGAHRTW